VSGLKASLYANLKKEDPLDIGFIGFVAGLEDELYRQLTSEIRKPLKRRDGSTEWRWVPLAGVAQEGLDTHLYAQAAAINCGWTAKSDEQWEVLRGRWEPAESNEPPLLAAIVAAPSAVAPRAAARPPRRQTFPSRWLD
jgi:phage terminase large subunit GpA-like protein